MAPQTKLQVEGVISPATDNWNTGIDDDIHYGLIAQEAEQAIIESRGDRQITSIDNDFFNDLTSSCFETKVCHSLTCAQYTT